MIAVNQLNNYCPYEIGDIYLTLRDENPSNRWGGTTWERIKDRFLLAAGDSYATGGTGGEASHTLTVSEMPSHRHGSSSYQVGYPSSYTGSDNYVTFVNNGTTSSNAGGSGDGTVKTSYVGGSAAHNNMPPYLTVHMWKRVS